MQSTRRRFIGDVGYGMLAATVGANLVVDMGLASKSHAASVDTDSRLLFGDLEPLVALLQETEADKLLPLLVQRLKDGLELRTLVSAAALANARTFGGEDYIGFHTMMALAPSYRMSFEVPPRLRALPVLKVLYRNTNRIHEFGGKDREVLHRIEQASNDPLLALEVGTREMLRDAVRARDVVKAENYFAQLTRPQVGADAGADSQNKLAHQALNHALFCVEDETEVHRVALPYRAWDLLDIVGMEHAHTLLRQSIRYCVKAGTMNHGAESESPSTLLPKLFDQYRLDQPLTTFKPVDHVWIRRFAETIFASTATQAAEAAAAAIAEGVDPDAIGRSMTLAANQLVLRDRGRTFREELPGKPLGSVHGDSIGVHATDSANAWRNLAKHSDSSNLSACLILGCYQVAYDRVARGGDFLHWDSLPISQHTDRITTTDPTALVAQLDDAIKNNLQAQAAAIMARCVQAGHVAQDAFDCLLRHAVTEDGALHAEKYYRTVREEFATAAPEHRGEFAIALARVTASEYGRPAAGVQQASELLRF